MRCTLVSSLFTLPADIAHHPHEPVLSKDQFPWLLAPGYGCLVSRFVPHMTSVSKATPTGLSCAFSGHIPLRCPRQLQIYASPHFHLWLVDLILLQIPFGIAWTLAPPRAPPPAFLDVFTSSMTSSGIVGFFYSQFLLQLHHKLLTCMEENKPCLFIIFWSH